MKIFWKYSERKMSVQELTNELAKIEKQINELNEEGPQEKVGMIDYETSRQHILSLLHRAKQGLMMIRAEKFKNR